MNRRSFLKFLVLLPFFPKALIPKEKIYDAQMLHRYSVGSLDWRFVYGSDAT